MDTELYIHDTTAAHCRGSEDIIAPSERAAEAIIKTWAYECNFTNLKFKTAKLKEKIELI